MTLIHNKKKIVFALISIALAFVIIASAVCFLVYMAENYGQGVVTKISINQKSIDTMELRIKYRFATGGYSVCTVPEDEGEYIGDGMIDYDGALGKYRVMINFGEVEPPDSFSKKMDENGIIQLTEDIRARVARPSDHGFVLYIGADKPISVDPIDHGDLNPLGGTLKIPIKLNQE